jgi:acyl-CoA thioester hydrolase
MPTPHLIPVQLRWGDEDRYGHVNNVVFFRLLEEARARWITGANPEDNLLTHGLLVHEAQLTYHSPLHYREEPVFVELVVTKLGGASIDIACRVLDTTHPAAICFASGHIRLVSYDFDTELPRRLGEAEREWLEAQA